MLVDTEDLHAVEAMGIVQQRGLSACQDRGVGGVPGDPQRRSHPGDRHALQPQGPQPPLHRRAGQTGSGLSQPVRVLPPHPPAVPAGEAPHTHHQLGGPPGHRHVRQAPGHRPPSRPLRPAHLAEGILQADGHAALDHRPLRRQELTHRGQSQGLQAQEGRQVGAGEGSLRHVEVSLMACVAAPIIGGPRPPPAQRRTHPTPPKNPIGPAYHTLKCEEPVYSENFEVERRIVGSSPLARGLRADDHAGPGDGRIIPARAGFTEPISRPSATVRDHPRSRGVYRRVDGRQAAGGGSSPLARGLRDQGLVRRADFEDHPRSRGVYSGMLCADHIAWGSSPLARGLLRHAVRRPHRLGIIPARAGFTDDGFFRSHRRTDHPRSRGVYMGMQSRPEIVLGSSPLARGLR